MNAVASIDYDRQYFDAFYENWIAYRRRWRRYAIPFAVIFFLVTAIALWFLPSHRPIAGGFFIVALLNLIDAYTHRLRWVRQRLASVAVDKRAELTFTDDKIQISTPNIEGTMTYDGFGVVSIAPDGIFLVPDTGVSIFVPKTSFADPDAFGRVCSRLAEHVAQRSSDG
jgi:hypothetical protein